MKKGNVKTNNKKVDVKVIMLGGSACGKTSLCRRFLHNTFSDGYKSNCGGGEFNLLKEILKDNRLIQTAVWDTTGQERFAQLLPRTYFRDVDGIVLVYDLCSELTFKQMFFWWETFLAETNVHDVPVIVVGNKLDTADKKREVTRERAEKWCRDNGGFQHIETSAKDGTNVKTVFENIATMAINHRLEITRREEKDAEIIRLPQQNEVKKSWCPC